MDASRTTFVDYTSFFAAASGGVSPFPYQVRLGQEAAWPDLLRVPTGAGKTLAVTVSWLWRRRYHPDARTRAETPRRLVYVLPMRTLVEQTDRVCREILERLVRTGDDRVRVQLLYGGNADDEWALYPERDIILIGTQDMLLSRALNRGYAENRFSWPRSYGLLNSDALWIADEVQLMGSALTTTVQLAHFRRQMGTIGPCVTLWMSATAHPEWLTTVNATARPTLWELDDHDRATEVLACRLRATKRLRHLPIESSQTAGKKAKKAVDTAVAIMRVHQRGARTLVVLNTVERARELYVALNALKEVGGPQLLLIHGQFRPYERGKKEAQLMAAVDPQGPGVIVVATQVVEAGVDISARVLVTEVAPWACLVQRFGRCNRSGEYELAEVFWLDPPARQGTAAIDTEATPESKEEVQRCAPYTPREMRSAREKLQALEGHSVSPDGMGKLDVTLAFEPEHVLRRRDIVELFDTSADLTGADLDVSRFVRDGDDRDARVFWRDLDGKAPQRDIAGPARAESCVAPLGEVRELAKSQRLYWWNALDGEWQPRRGNEIRPAMVLLADASAGGYDPEIGWSREAKLPGLDISRTLQAESAAAAILAQPEEAVADDPLSVKRTWQTLAQHTAEVQKALEAVIAHMAALDDATREVLRHTARMHDWGKSHACFQRMLRAGAENDPAAPASHILLAKSASQGQRNERRGFRHELASALALLAVPEALPSNMPEDQRALIAYLIASHHGKVRLSLRAQPNEAAPGDGRTFARGVWDGDRLPEVELADGTVLPAVTLELEPMQMGRTARNRPSWLEMTLDLRDTRGPFILAYLEALLRAADMRASMGQFHLANQGGDA